jgi:hypothetical protein
MNTITKIAAALALVAILAAVAGAYAKKAGSLPASPEATVSRTLAGPGQRFN